MSVFPRVMSVFLYVGEPQVGSPNATETLLFRNSITNKHIQRNSGAETLPPLWAARASYAPEVATNSCEQHHRRELQESR